MHFDKLDRRCANHMLARRLAVQNKDMCVRILAAAEKSNLLSPGSGGVAVAGEDQLVEVYSVATALPKEGQQQQQQQRSAASSDAATLEFVQLMQEGWEALAHAQEILAHTTVRAFTHANSKPEVADAGSAARQNLTTGDGSAVRGRHKFHTQHELALNSRSVNWSCNGFQTASGLDGEGCRRGGTGARYRCQSGCDYDLCQTCWENDEDLNKPSVDDGGDEQVHFHAQTLVGPVDALQTKLEREWTSVYDCSQEQIVLAKRMVRGLFILLRSFVSAVEVETSISISAKPAQPSKTTKPKPVAAVDETASTSHFGAFREPLVLPLPPAATTASGVGPAWQSKQIVSPGTAAPAPSPAPAPALFSFSSSPAPAPASGFDADL
jgi:hypothetical protein